MTFAFDADAALAEIRNRTVDPAKAAKVAKVEEQIGQALAGHRSRSLEQRQEADMDEALDAFEERAAIREYCGGQCRPEAEKAALEEVAQAAKIRPEDLKQRWAAHPDARVYLVHLIAHGPTTLESVAIALGWTSTRAWQAEARLRAAGLVRRDRQGRAHLAAREKS